MRRFARVLCSLVALLHSTRGGYEEGFSSNGFQFQINRGVLSSSHLIGEDNGAVRNTIDRGAADERFPPVGLSYWVPYGDRTVAALSFPVVSHDLFTPVVLKHVVVPLEEAVGVYGKPVKKVMKPKSDVGVVVSRNSVLKRNLRDYARLSTYNGDTRGSDELVLELAKDLAASSGSKWESSKDKQSFVVVTLESRMKTGSPGGSFEVRRDVLHNGTVVFPSSDRSGHLVTIPFTLRNLQAASHIFEEYKGIDSHDRMQAVAFLKLLLGVHKDTFEDGRAAMERFQRRSSSLNRPDFVVNVEESRTDARDDRRRREATRREEDRHRGEAWLGTSTIGMRTISPPEFVENLVSVGEELLLKHPPHEVPLAYGAKPSTHYGPLNYN